MDHRIAKYDKIRITIIPDEFLPLAAITSIIMSYKKMLSLSLAATILPGILQVTTVKDGLYLTTASRPDSSRMTIANRPVSSITIP